MIRTGADLLPEVFAGTYLLLGFILFAVAKTHGKVPFIGSEATSTHEGVVMEWENGHGFVLVGGERWKAKSDEPLAAGQEVDVVAVDGLLLSVKAKQA